MRTCDVPLQAFAIGRIGFKDFFNVQALLDTVDIDEFLFNWYAAAAVVPEPLKGSSTQSPGLELTTMTLFKRFSGI